MNDDDPILCGLILCPLPGCGEALHLVWAAQCSLQQEIYTSGHVPGPDSAEARTWQVECEDGHVLLLPGPVVGCGCDVDVADCGHDWSDDYRSFQPRDIKRLRELIDQYTRRQA